MYKQSRQNSLTSVEKLVEGTRVNKKEDNLIINSFCFGRLAPRYITKKAKQKLKPSSKSDG